MAQPTVAELSTKVEALEEALQGAREAFAAQREELRELKARFEERDLKTRKQLSFLQKVAKGIIPIGPRQNAA